MTSLRSIVLLIVSSLLSLHAAFAWSSELGSRTISRSASPGVDLAGGTAEVPLTLSRSPEASGQLLGRAYAQWARGMALADATHQPKSTANGLVMDGAFSYQRNGSSVTLSLDAINNESFSRTTGTLRLELWATTSRPARGDSFNGYRLAVSSVFSPLLPRTFYSNIVRTAAFQEPPAGTYWMVLVLTEFNSQTCSVNDQYCLTDSGVFSNQQTFGAASPNVTIFSREADQCAENYPRGAYDILQVLVPGLFQAYPVGTSCSSLGMSFYAGLLENDSSIRVYTSNSNSALILCLSGAITNCTVAPSGPSYTDLWWNPNESGWGISLTYHPSGVIFAAWFTYDSLGNPKWYVVSECRVVNAACSGTVYETTGTPLGAPWNPARTTVRSVGSISLRFSGPTVAQMTYSVNGVSGTKTIVRQPF